MIGGGAHDVVSVIGAVYTHVRGGVGCPVDGVEESRIVGLGDGPDAAFIMDMEDLEGFSEPEHDGLGMIGRFDCEV